VIKGEPLVITLEKFIKPLRECLWVVEELKGRKIDLR